ncbi:MAG: hypothetical protein LBF83_03575, partial [Spirochaetaceae bacterium]|nr:hypothetical protein [Spirochaetaceae bacterium]
IPPGWVFNDVSKFPFCTSGLGLDEQIFQEDFMKNGICFLGLAALRRNNGLTLPKPSCYDVEAVREAPVQRSFLRRISLNRGL